MELRHLRYFVAVAEELHFGRAAKRLNVVQPALSKQISRLENELGVRLLNRTKRSVKLTEAGGVFLEDARRVLDQSERAVLKARLIAQGEIGFLEVGTVGSATYGVFTEVWGLYRKRFPYVALAPHEMTTAKQVEALRDGDLEIGYLRLPADYVDEDLEVRTFLREPLMAALSTTHPLSSWLVAGTPSAMSHVGNVPGFHHALCAWSPRGDRRDGRP